MAEENEEMKKEINEEDVKAIENIEIGEKKEIEQLKPAKAEIKDVKIENRQGNDCLVLKIKHPDKEEPISISSIKIKKFNKLKVNGLWIGRDEHGKIPYNSALAELLRRVEAKTISELVGKVVELDTLSINEPVLVVKGY